MVVSSGRLERKFAAFAVWIGAGYIQKKKESWGMRTLCGSKLTIRISHNSKAETLLSKSPN